MLASTSRAGADVLAHFLSPFFFSLSFPSPSGIRGILWVVQSVDLWRVSQPHFEGAMKYSDRHLAGLSAGPPDRVELIGAGSLGYGTGPSFG